VDVHHVQSVGSTDCSHPNRFFLCCTIVFGTLGGAVPCTVCQSCFLDTGIPGFGINTEYRKCLRRFLNIVPSLWVRVRAWGFYDALPAHCFCLIAPVF
jgi:hypothetical protein